MKRVLFAVALAVAITAPSVAVSAELSGKLGRWEYRLKVTHPGTKSEGSWGTLSYDGKKVPEGTTVNDFYRTPWGKIYWVGMPASKWGGHGWMLEPVRGRELTPPVAKELRVERVAPGRTKAELVDLLLDHNATVRHRAGSALRKLGPADEDAERRFLNLAKHSSAARRERGVEALGRLNSQSLQVITALTAAIQDTDADVRLAAALALGRTLKPWQAEPAPAGRSARTGAGAEGQRPACSLSRSHRAGRAWRGSALGDAGAHRATEDREGLASALDRRLCPRQVRACGQGCCACADRGAGGQARERSDAGRVRTWQDRMRCRIGRTYQDSGRSAQ